jgi:lipoprotein-anchoring transpeptidase ErfK/SrfK
MGRKAQISVVVVVVMAIVGALLVYWWDTTYENTISEGVTIGGVDVGGLEAEDAASQVRSNLITPLEKEVVVRHDGTTYKLNPDKVKIRADVNGMVDEALRVSQDGGILARTWRRVGGEEVEHSIDPQIAYSKGAVDEFVETIAADVDAEPVNATVEPTSTSIEPVPAQPGINLDEGHLTRQVEQALEDPADRTLAVKTEKIKPDVTTGELAEQYPTYIVVDRSSFELRLYKDLELEKTYTVAIGAVGYDTPTGLYSIQDKQVDPVWNVPDSDWAGDLAGTTVPPGPENPLKARWMGIYNGAGIHGTTDIGSLGSAASHGCVRMSEADVIDLYDRVDVGTPIYIS